MLSWRRAASFLADPVGEEKAGEAGLVAERPDGGARCPAHPGPPLLVGRPHGRMTVAVASGSSARATGIVTVVRMADEGRSRALFAVCVTWVITGSLLTERCRVHLVRE